MPAIGRRINIFITPAQEEFLLKRSAHVQVERCQRISPSQYLLELLTRDMESHQTAVSDGGQKAGAGLQLRLKPPHRG